MPCYLDGLVLSFWTWRGSSIVPRWLAYHIRHERNSREDSRFAAIVSAQAAGTDRVGCRHVSDRLEGYQGRGGGPKCPAPAGEGGRERRQGRRASGRGRGSEWQREEFSKRFSGVRSPVDSTGVPRPDLVAAAGPGLLGMTTFEQAGMAGFPAGPKKKTKWAQAR